MVVPPRESDSTGSTPASSRWSRNSRSCRLAHVSIEQRLRVRPGIPEKVDSTERWFGLRSVAPRRERPRSQRLDVEFPLRRWIAR